MPQHMPFREQALQHYNQQNQPAILPRFVSLRFAALLWVVLAFCVGAALASWLVQIPSYTVLAGVVQAKAGAGIVLFLPAGQVAQVQPGTPVQIQLGTHGPQFTTAIASVEAGVMSPATARQRYGLGSAAWGVITEPSLAVIVPLAPAFALKTYAGSMVTAQVQIGTSPVFRLLPGLSSSMGGRNA